MSLSTVVRIRALAAIAVLPLAIVACSRPDAKPTPSVAPAAAAPKVTTTAAATGDANPVWHYEGDEGPAKWGTLSAKFASCANGRAQSPIDIVAPARRATTDAIALNFAPANLRIVHHEHVADAINNGHTIQVNYSEGDTLTVGGDRVSTRAVPLSCPKRTYRQRYSFPDGDALLYTRPPMVNLP